MLGIKRSVHLMTVQTVLQYGQERKLFLTKISVCDMNTLEKEQ